MSTAEARVTLVTRAHCHLCEDVRPIVESVCADLGARWREVDVDSDPGLLAAYADLVPVVLVDGREVAHWFLSEKQLRAALAS